MAITAKNEGTKFPQAPDGQHVAVCCDVHDLGVVKTNWNGEDKEKHMVRVWFQIGESDEQDRRFLVGQRFTLSLHEKANLRQFLESWRGKAYTEDEADGGVDVELMIGVSALLQVARNKKDYANITSIMRLPKGMEAIKVEDFVRFRDRDAVTGARHSQPADEAVDDDDDDLPF